MRETAQGPFFTWSNRRSFCGRFFVRPAPLCFFFVTTLFINAIELGATEGISSDSLVCRGMPLSTSQSGPANLSCLCDGVNLTQRASRREAIPQNMTNDYRLHFCTLFPLYEVLNAAVLRNRTFCHEQLKRLEEAERNANNSFENFKGIIERMDCGLDGREHTYSVTATCKNCLDAYKNWICFAEVSAAILDLNRTSSSRRRPCPNLCETVLQQCPYFPPVPNSKDSLVQVGYSAFNCVDCEEWQEEDESSGDGCLDVTPIKNAEGVSALSTPKPTQTTKGVPTANTTTSNSTDSNNR